jgi:subtilisin family serine protease
VAHLRDGRFRSSIIGQLRLPPDDAPSGEVDPDETVPMLVEVNVLFPGGLRAVRDAFYRAWEPFAQAQGWRRGQPVPATSVEPQVPAGLELISPKLYQCMLSRNAVRDMVALDERLAREQGTPPAIFRVWPDYLLEAQIDRSAPTVKADAAWRSYGASGKGVVWAVIDSGIDGCHPHFAALELAAQAAGQGPAGGRTSGLHRDFSYLVQFGGVAPQAPPPPPGAGGDRSALTDAGGHGTHVAGIIAGCAPDGAVARVALSREPTGESGYVPRLRVGRLSGMAPACELVSLKVMRRSPQGTWVTSSAAVIRALTYLRDEVNVDPGVLRVHGVNMSLGCAWDPQDYAAGQSPLCQAVNQLVASGVIVVVSAGNYGAQTGTNSGDATAVMGSITEPAHAEDCIAVGSTHREAPHTFGTTWTSGKGPTLDGRMKPDVVAPGEWIASAATGEVRATAGLNPPSAAPAQPATPPAAGSPAPVAPAAVAPAAVAPVAVVPVAVVPVAGAAAATPVATPVQADDVLLTYAEQSGTSMAAPHVSGVVAAFLSARPEFIGRPRQVKQLLCANATDLGRERYAQGAGLVDLMRMLANV